MNMRICTDRRIRSALHNWKSAWRRDPGSTLDPQNIDGPLPFTSVAFLALAFVRLHIDIGPHRSLETRDPHAMAANLSKMEPPRRGPRVATALLHAVHAMSIPVRMGVDYVARSQMFFWSCQHSICALETGIFVWKWLQRVELESDRNDLARKPLAHKRLVMPRMITTLLTPMIAAERHVICWIRALVKEALESLEPSALGLDNDDVNNLSASQLGMVVLHIWARTLSGNSLWPFIRQISNTFDILARQSVSTTAI
jgi:hypothetical protein